MGVKLFMSTSLNGLIARPDGSGDFFSDICWHGFVELVRDAGGLIWGRATHDLIRGWSSFKRDLVDSSVRGVVLTGQRNYSVEKSWETAASPRQALRTLADAGIEHAVLAGGTKTNSAFISEGLVDDVTLFVESIIIPSGLPLLEKDMRDLRCRVIDVRRLTERVARLDLSVQSSHREQVQAQFPASQSQQS